MIKAPHREVFEANKGYRLYSGDRSLLMHVLALGKHFTPQQKGVGANAFLEFIESVGQRPKSGRAATRSLSIADFPEQTDATFYRFVKDDVLALLQAGQFQFGSPSYYTTIEDDARADHIEDYGTIFFEGRVRVVLTLRSGPFWVRNFGYISEERGVYRCRRNDFPTSR